MANTEIYNFMTINETGDTDEITWTKQQLFQKIPTLEKRDLYLIDKKFLFKISSILSKDKTILVKLDYIRCIIYNKVAYIVTSNDYDSNYGGNRGSGNNTIVDFRLMKLYKNLSESIKNKNNKMKFKLKILEEIFINVTDYFEEEVEKLAPEVSIISNNLTTDHINISANKNFISMHNNLLSLQSRLKDIYELFDGISSEKEENDNLNKYIEEDGEKKKVTFYDLIDTYGNIFEDNYKDAKEMLNMLSIMLKITNTNLDFVRNKLSLFNIYLDVITIGIALGSLIAGLYGMNVPNQFENADSAFPIIVTVVVVIIIITFVITKFIQRLILK